ncbi:MAG: hypothetical protein AAF676_17060, partial [Pseudomonadota bacterium]
MVGLVEEGEGVAAGRRCLIRRGVDHAVEGGDPAVVGPDLHGVADVDDIGPGLRQHVDPVAVPVAGLEPSGGAVGGEDGERAVVRMGAAAELAGLGRLVLLGVADDAERRHVLVELVGEEGLGQIERQGEGAHEVVGEGVHAAVVGGEGRLEIRRRVGPEVGVKMLACVGAVPIGGVGAFFGDVDGADVDHLLQIGRSVVAEAGGEAFALERGVAAGDLGRGLADLQLFRLGQVEEVGDGGVGGVDERLFDPVAGEQEEADVAGSGVDLRGDGGLAVGGSGEERGEVDGGDGHRGASCGGVGPEEPTRFETDGRRLRQGVAGPGRGARGGGCGGSVVAETGGTGAGGGGG